MRSIEIIVYGMVLFGGVLCLHSQYQPSSRDGNDKRQQPQRYMKLIGFAVVIYGGLKLLGALI